MTGRASGELDVLVPPLKTSFKVTLFAFNRFVFTQEAVYVCVVFFLFFSEREASVFVLSVFVDGDVSRMPDAPRQWLSVNRSRQTLS